MLLLFSDTSESTLGCGSTVTFAANIASLLCLPFSSSASTNALLPVANSDSGSHMSQGKVVNPSLQHTPLPSMALVIKSLRHSVMLLMYSKPARIHVSSGSASTIGRIVDSEEECRRKMFDGLPFRPPRPAPCAKFINPQG